MTQAKNRDHDSKPSGWLKPLNNQGRLVIQFQLGGKTYKFAPVIKGKFDNVSDYRVACHVCEDIEHDIRRGEFDTSLEKYKPKTDITTVEVTEERLDLTLGVLWEQYKKDKELVVEKTTQKADWSRTERALTKCNLQSCTDFNQIKDIMLGQYSVTSSRIILANLSAAINYAIKKGLITTNPLNQAIADLKRVEKRKQVENGTTSRESFSKTERDRIIQAFTDNEFCPKYSRVKHSYYAPFVRFLFFTGCRPEDAIALTWSDIQGNQIVFNKAYSKGILKGGKNSKHGGKAMRKFPINSALSTMIEEYKSSLPEDKTKPNCLVFPSVEGSYINLENFTARIWQKIVESLNQLGEVRKYLPTYNCRHTFITLCLEANTPVHTVAKWVGNSPEVIYANYCSDMSQIQVPEI